MRRAPLIPLPHNAGWMAESCFRRSLEKVEVGSGRSNNIGLRLRPAKERRLPKT